MNKKAEWMSTLRGLGAFLVFFSHLKLALPDNLMFTLGRCGVVLFFLMSGYLCYNSRVKRTCKQYMFNRFVRMYPIFWCLVLFGWIIRGTNGGGYSLINLLANFTLFQQFLGQDNVLGSSWMMPIQVCFFIMVAVIGNMFYKNKHCVFANVCIFALLSVIFGLMRSFLNKPIPTAFPLLIMVAFIGMSMYMYDDGMINLKENILGICIFEISLGISTYSSYDNWVFYIIAYNLGVLAFVVFKLFNIDVSCLKNLGKIGFSFFLCFDIVYYLLVMLGVCVKEELMSLWACLLHFIVSTAISFLITNFLEKPLVEKSKKWEINL